MDGLNQETKKSLFEPVKVSTLVYNENGKQNTYNSTNAPPQLFRCFSQGLLISEKEDHIDWRVWNLVSSITMSTVEDDGESSNSEMIDINEDEASDASKKEEWKKERAMKLGYHAQKEIVYNKLLPYSGKIWTKMT